MPRSTRLLALLQALRGHRRPVTAAVLARGLEVSERTIYRDIAALAAEGAPIQGEAGIGYVLGPGLFLPPLMLTEEETEAVLLGLRYVDQRGDETLARAAADARAKLTAMLPPAMQPAAEAPLAMPGPPPAAFPANPVPLGVLRAAIRGRTRLAIAYRAAPDRPSERIIWPLQLGFTDSARVLSAWCELRQAFRFFRTDRIAAATPAGPYPGRRDALLRAFRAQLDPPDRS